MLFYLYEIFWLKGSGEPKEFLANLGECIEKLESTLQCAFLIYTAHPLSEIMNWISHFRGFFFLILFSFFKDRLSTSNCPHKINLFIF